MKSIVLLSDTHNKFDERIVPYLKNVDEIWHAGDVGSLEIIEKLALYGKVRAVYGNIDNHIIRTELKNTLLFYCEKVYVLMTHIGGYPKRYNKNIISIIKEKKPNLFISGHSHILKIIYDKENELLHMNPGAVGDFGIHKLKTIICFNIKGSNIQDLQIIEFSRK
jgi:hypothetical protein